MQILREKGVSIDEPRYIATTAWTTDELMDAIDAEKPKGPFELVTLLIGVNDQYRARPLKQFVAGFAPVLKSAVRFTGNKPSRLVALSIPDWGQTPYAAGKDNSGITRDIDAYNEQKRRAVAAAGGAWVDVTVASRRMVTDRALVVSDGLHPSGTLYREWAELAAPAALAALSR